MNKAKKMNGFLYACWSVDGKVNKSFSEQFLVSFKSLKKAVPNAKVALYTNIKFDNTYGIDHIIYDKNIDKTFICKAAGMLKSPFQNTIYLDNDIIVVRKTICQIFKMLSEFSFAVTYSSGGGVCPVPNGGLIAVKKSEFTNSILEKWLKKDREDGKIYWRPDLKIYDYDDQLSFEPFYRKYIKEFFILPAYFNYRPMIIGSFKKNAVLLHTRNMSTIENLTEKIIKFLKKPII